MTTRAQETLKPSTEEGGDEMRAYIEAFKACAALKETEGLRVVRQGSRRPLICAVAACLVAGCSSGPPSRAVHILGKAIDVANRPASKRWLFHLDGGPDYEVVLRFALNGESVSFASVSCRRQGGTLLLDPLEGVGEILIPAPVLNEGITAALSLSPEESRQDASEMMMAEQGYTMSVSLQLDRSAGAWVSAVDIPLPAAPFDRIGFGHGSTHVTEKYTFGSKILFLSMDGEGGAHAYFSVHAQGRVRPTGTSTPALPQ